MARGEISFADFLYAVHTLKADDEAAAQIVVMLGLEQTLTCFGRSKPGAYETRPGETGITPTTPLPPPCPVQAKSESSESLIWPASLSQVQGVGRTSSPPPWLTDTTVEAIRPASSKPLRKMMVIDPLFARRSQRAILCACLATQASEGEIDAEELAAMLSELKTVISFPRLSTTTVRRGVQVLLDDSSSFTPYAADREIISTAIADIVGRQHVSVYRFRGSPERGVFQLRRNSERWVPPHAGTVVALVSDLGLGGPLFSAERGSVSEWMRVIARARQAGCPLVVFNPLPPKRWPAELARMATIVQWDRTTSIRSVKRALPKGHRYQL